jgi:DNA-binding transcriptional LysR family regulator
MKLKICCYNEEKLMRLLADMALFVEVANTRHFGRAAAALDIPASTLSRRIRALEKELGVPLIHRSTRSFALTDAGLACYERSRKLIAEATQIREDLAGSAAKAFGHIRIGLPLDLAQTIFLPMFAEFIRSNQASPSRSSTSRVTPAFWLKHWISPFWLRIRPRCGTPRSGHEGSERSHASSSLQSNI